MSKTIQVGVDKNEQNKAIESRKAKVRASLDLLSRSGPRGPEREAWLLREIEDVLGLLIEERITGNRPPLGTEVSDTQLILWEALR